MQNTRHFQIISVVLSCFLIFMFGSCSKDATDTGDDIVPPSPPFQLSDFSPANECASCHPTYYDEWSGSMHAYAFLDPINTIWMNSLIDQLGAEELGAACVQCHSPIGMLTGQTPVGFIKENVDPLVKEGITCDACHLMNQASPTAFGEAVYHYDVKSGNRFASIADPLENSFHASAALPFYRKSAACLPCHDFVNASGLPAEITFTEWAESPYIAMGVECQDCHMPTYTGQAAPGAPQRENLHRHDFIGVDIALLDNFPNKPEQQAKIEQLLQNSVTMNTEIPSQVQAGSHLQLDVAITNDKTGHDVPSSVTFVRQMWLEVTVTHGADTLYTSGYFDANGDLMDANSELNPNGDPDLVLFQSQLYRNGQPANVVTADSITIRTIAPFETKRAHYDIPIPGGLNGTLDVRARLRFRTFPPYAIRDGGAQFIPNLPIFEMEQASGIVSIVP